MAAASRTQPTTFEFDEDVVAFVVVVVGRVVVVVDGCVRVVVVVGSVVVVVGGVVVVVVVAGAVVVVTAAVVVVVSCAAALPPIRRPNTSGAVAHAPSIVPASRAALECIEHSLRAPAVAQRDHGRRQGGSELIERASLVQARGFLTQRLSLCRDEPTGAPQATAGDEG